MSNMNLGGEAGKFDADVAGCIAQSDKKYTLVLKLLQLFFSAIINQYKVQSRFGSMRERSFTCT